MTCFFGSKYCRIGVDAISDFAFLNVARCAVDQLNIMFFSGQLCSSFNDGTQILAI